MPAKSKTPLSAFGTRLPKATLSRLQSVSEHTGLPQSTIVARLLEHWFAGGKVTGLPAAEES